MKAMVLAAGKGTRLGALSEKTPKPLMKAGGAPILQYVIEALKQAGVSELIINLHYLGDQVVEFLETKGNFGLEVSFSYEERLLGTGGGLNKVREHFRGEECFLLCNADVYTDLDFKGLIAAQKASGALATLAVMDRPSGRRLLFDGDSNLIGWQNSGGASSGNTAGAASSLAFSGLQALSDRVFAYMPEDLSEFSIIETYMAATKVDPVKAYRMDDAYWIDIGTPEKLAELRERLGDK